MSKIIHNTKTNFSPKKEAFQYQSIAFEVLKDLDYAAIFHEQGLGKTKIAIDLILYWLQYRDIDTVLVVTKKQLIKNWEDEFSVHSFLQTKTLSSKRKENFYTFNSVARVIITNFETISTEKERLKLFLKARNVSIIIDESVKIKNPESKLTIDFFDLSDYFKIKVIMTGTPIANRPYDIWSQIYFLDKGKSLGNNFLEFKSTNDLRNDFINDSENRNKFEESISSIYSKISKFSIRETKESSGIKLPKKEIETIICDFESQQLRMYNQILRDLKIELVKNDKITFDDESVLLKRLLRLNQVTSNPRLIDDSYNYQSGKEKQLEELLKKIVTMGDKCIVWSIFIDNINYFANIFSDFNPRCIHGKMAMEDRNRSVDVFKNDLNCKILFATPQSAKEGLTLTVANHVIFYDRGFNLDDYLQAQDRIHRISQNKTCYIYNLCIKDSIDEWIGYLLDAKHRAALLTQGDISRSKYEENADYSYAEIIKEIIDTGEVIYDK